MSKSPVKTTAKVSTNTATARVAPSRATTDAVRNPAQPRPVVTNATTGLTVESQEAADREVNQRSRLAADAASRSSDKRREEMEKAPGKPFQPARDALNKFSEEIQKMRDEDREFWKPSQMRLLRDEAAGILRSLEDMVTGDVD
ncbi:MAG: hypothetical protein H0T60_13745 [Acidobacteria bacterium]|nr:hypothetical protein [Acidobacteriota bacterium]